MFWKSVISILERSISYTSVLSLCTWIVLLTSKVHLHKSVISELGLTDPAVKSFRCIWSGFLGWIRDKSLEHMLWLEGVCKSCSQLRASLPLSAVDQGHPWECLTGTVYKIESLIQHFHFANEGDILCLLSHNPTAWHLSLVTVLKSVWQIWVWGLSLPWPIVIILNESGSFSGAWACCLQNEASDTYLLL